MLQLSIFIDNIDVVHFLDFFLICFLAKAGAPSTPVVEDVDKNSVKLSWQKPRNDGGSPIKGKLHLY